MDYGYAWQIMKYDLHYTPYFLELTTLRHTVNLIYYVQCLSHISLSIYYLKNVLINLLLIECVLRKSQSGNHIPDAIKKQNNDWSRNLRGKAMHWLVYLHLYYLHHYCTGVRRLRKRFANLYLFKWFNRKSDINAILYESKKQVYFENGNNSIWPYDYIPQYCTATPICSWNCRVH